MYLFASVSICSLDVWKLIYKKKYLQWSKNYIYDEIYSIALHSVLIDTTYTYIKCVWYEQPIRAEVRLISFNVTHVTDICV